MLEWLVGSVVSLQRIDVIGLFLIGCIIGWVALGVYVSLGCSGSIDQW